MYDYNITARESADFIADMLEMAADFQFPSEGDLEEMATVYLISMPLPTVPLEVAEKWDR
jgi:hypothetical protein